MKSNIVTKNISTIMLHWSIIRMVAIEKLMFDQFYLTHKH